EELSGRLQDVWIDSFKLRVNQSRFHRNEEVRRNEKPVQRANREEGECSVQPRKSFRTALVNASGVKEVREKVVGEENEALQVEVDVSVLQELENSYVGVLAINVDVRRIKTTLYMEGLTHITVTDM
ncbi:hypothetical protein A2U01_0059427, partial [Trifolium medium]|nr:hypothetical protein [Trifolium medium]